MKQKELEEIAKLGYTKCKRDKDGLIEEILRSENGKLVLYEKGKKRKVIDSIESEGK